MHACHDGWAHKIAALSNEIRYGSTGEVETLDEEHGRSERGTRLRCSRRSVCTQSADRYSRLLQRPMKVLQRTAQRGRIGADEVESTPQERYLGESVDVGAEKARDGRWNVHGCRAGGHCFCLLVALNGEVVPDEIANHALRAEARGDLRQRSDSERSPTGPILKERCSVDAQRVGEILDRPTPRVSEAQEFRDESRRMAHVAQVVTSPF